MTIKLIALIRNLRSSTFLRHNAVFFAGSLVMSVLNYLYYPLLGRLLSTSDFGEVQTLVSLFLQATIFLSVIGNVAVNIVSNESNARLRNRVVFELERFALAITLAGLAVVLLLAPQLQVFLQFEHIAPFYLLALVLLVSVPGSLHNAYLRGRSAFGQLSVAGIIGSLAKLVFSTGLVLLGWRTLGAIGGLVAAQALSLVYAMIQTRRLGLTSPEPPRLWRRPDLAVMRPHVAYGWLVLIVSFMSTTLFSFDIVVVKHYFPAEVAGQYAGVATIARILFFLTGSISAVLLSSVKLSASSAVNRRLLLRSAALQTAIGGSVLAVFMLAPRAIIHLLIGVKYTPYAQLLPRLSLALFLLALANLLFNYDLALRRRSAAVVAVSGVIVMAIFVGMHHATLGAVVDSLLGGSLVILLLRAADTVRRYLGTNYHSHAQSRSH